jgi:tRNA 2-thiouridine synthesizing protein A
MGELCPVPIIRTAEAMKEMAAGEVLELVGDDPGIVPDIEAWCRSHHHKLLSLEREGGTIRARVQKID